MDKIRRVVIVIAILIFCSLIITYGIIKSQKNNEETLNKLDTIIKDSYLDILVDFGNYSNDNINQEKLLETGMRIASELNLVKEGENETGSYSQYVLLEDMNKILSELTGKEVTEPIIIDVHKWYYPYNEQYKQYDIIPMGTDRIHLREIKSLKKVDDIFYLECTARTGYDSFEYYIDNVKLELKYMPNNELVKYQIINIESTQRWWIPKNAKDVDLDKIVAKEVVEPKAKEYVYQYYNMTVNTPAAFELSYSDTELNVYSVITNGYINIQDKLCWRIVYSTSDLILGPIIIYYDAYTGEYLGVGMKD